MVLPGCQLGKEIDEPVAGAESGRREKDRTADR